MEVYKLRTIPSYWFILDQYSSKLSYCIYSYAVYIYNMKQLDIKEIEMIYYTDWYFKKINVLINQFNVLLNYKV